MEKFGRKPYKLKVPRNDIAVAHSMRGAAGSGFHTDTKYTRKIKHKKPEDLNGKETI
jgi:hypothetical protein